jgi:hypothetical protein
MTSVKNGRKNQNTSDYIRLRQLPTFQNDFRPGLDRCSRFSSLSNFNHKKGGSHPLKNPRPALISLNLKELI